MFLPEMQRFSCSLASNLSLWNFWKDERRFLVPSSLQLPFWVEVIALNAAGSWQDFASEFSWRRQRLALVSSTSATAVVSRLVFATLPRLDSAGGWSPFPYSEVVTNITRCNNLPLIVKPSNCVSILPLKETMGTGRNSSQSTTESSVLRRHLPSHYLHVVVRFPADRRSSGRFHGGARGPAAADSRLQQVVQLPVHRRSLWRFRGYGRCVSLGSAGTRRTFGFHAVPIMTCFQQLVHFFG